MTRAITAMFVLLVCSCDGFVGEVKFDPPQGPPIAIVDPEYVVLRPVVSNPSSSMKAETVDGRTVYYEPSQRILDLRHLDPRTAEISEGLAGEYVVLIRTTDEGNQLLQAWTSANVEALVGVFVGGRLISAPRIKSKLSDVILLEAGFTKPESQAIVARLRRGGASG